MTSWIIQQSGVVYGDHHTVRAGTGKGRSRGGGLVRRPNGYGAGGDDLEARGNFMTSVFEGFGAEGRAGMLYFYGDDEKGAGAACGRGEELDGRGTGDVLVLDD